MEQKKTLITAHSGADGTPENSMEFVRHVLAAQADVLEVDVRMGKNRELIISHDKTEKETVRLAEVFESVKHVPYIRINCDLKEAGIEENVFRLAKECALPVRRILFSGSVSRKDLEENDSWSEVEIYWNVEECIPDIYSERRFCEKKGLSAKELDKLVTDCRQYRITVININENLLTGTLIEKMKENGIGISVWTVNEPEQIEKFVKCGIHNITTRNLTAALAVREKRNNHDFI